MYVCMCIYIYIYIYIYVRRVHHRAAAQRRHQAVGRRHAERPERAGPGPPEFEEYAVLQLTTPCHTILYSNDVSYNILRGVALLMRTSYCSPEAYSAETLEKYITKEGLQPGGGGHLQDFFKGLLSYYYNSYY